MGLSGGALILLGAALLAAAGAVAAGLAALAAGSLRRTAGRVATQVREIRRHPVIGDLPLEPAPAFRSLTLEVNHLLGDLRGRLREAGHRAVALQALTDGPPNLAFVSTDADWRIVSFSRGAEAMTGWKGEEILDRHLETLFVPGDWERLLPKLARRAVRDAGIVEVAMLQRRDGTAVPAELSMAPGPADGGAGGALLLVARELTEDRELQRRLRDSEERYRNLVEGMRDGVFIVQGERLVYVNPALARQVGEEREALTGRPFKDLIDARDLLPVLETVTRAGAGGEDSSGEMTCRLGVRGGPPIEARIAWSRTEFRGGRAVIGTVADLTERARLEQVVAASEGRLRATLESTADGLLVLGDSAHGRAVAVANRAFCALFGLAAERIAGLGADDLGRALLERAADPDRLRPFLECLRAEGEGRLEGVEIRQPRRALADLSIGDVQTASGEVIGRILTARDVTARADLESGLRQGVDDLSRAKTDLEAAYRELAGAQTALAQRNEQLETLNAELRSLDEMKSSLLANVSHELHTPLVSIKGYTEMILKRRLGPLTPEQERGLSVALRNIDRLVEMIDNLLSFSRMEKGETQLHLENVPLWQIVDEAVEMVGERIRKRNLSLTTEYQTDDLVIRADRGKILQVLTNLLTNAVKFNRDGGRITIMARPGPRGTLEVDVGDTGIGIAPAEQEKIFERFYQVESSPSRRYEGTGIGLSIVRDILRLHGGSIRVQSEPGRGSTFTFTVPLVRDRDASESRPPAGRKRSRE